MILSRSYRVLLFFVSILFFAKSYAGNDIDDRALALSKNIRCLVCDNQSVYDSDSQFAVEIKYLLHDLVNKNITDEQIYKNISDIYGKEVLFENDFSYDTLLLWLAPMLLLVLGGYYIQARLVSEQES